MIEDVFPVDLLPGFGSKASGADVSLALGITTTQMQGRPRSGGTYRIKAQHYRDFDPNDIKFWNFRGDAQQFIGLWNSKQVLALRGFGAWIENSGNDPVPFQRLLVNDFPDQFRGFKDFRWRDRGILGLNVEYRWPIWVAERIDGPGADFYLLGDFGQVFGDLEEITWDNLTVSYGFGTRFVVTPAFQGRIELGFSNEETVFLLEGVQIFQAFEGIFLSGQEPVPSR